jgi:hypothetical protein
MPGGRINLRLLLIRGGEFMQEDKQDTKDISRGVSEVQPFRMRLPGFISDEQVGLGDAVKRVTYAMGIPPCGGCEQRAAALNRWVVFSRR